jgi:hypothetical protein
LLPKNLFASINADSPPGTAANLLLALLDEQKQAWPQLDEGYRALGSAEFRELNCNGFSVTLQCNPRRIVSTSAKVDDNSIRQRKCFLCPENLPESQHAIAYHQEFLLLCNPNPIFERHFTVSSITHVPQALEANVGTLLSLTEDLSPMFAVFYNGPECGASAPDHLHFQVSPAGALPVEREVKNEKRLMAKKVLDSVRYSSLSHYGRRVLIMESPTRKNMATSIAGLLASMKKVFATTREPKLNLLTSFQQGVWRAIAFPRRKHRPDVYFREEQERVVVSPALVDMGGMVITPRKRDFDRIDAKMMEGILEEVSVSNQQLENIFVAI